VAGKIEITDPDGNSVDVDGAGNLCVAAGTRAAAVSLAAVTANGNGTAVDFGAARQNISLVIFTTGSPTGGTVTLQVSHDGTNWFASTTTATVSANLASGTLQNGAWRYARAVLSGLTGGTAPTVTATLMAN
jgi:hypothetical protein